MVFLMHINSIVIFVSIVRPRISGRPYTHLLIKPRSECSWVRKQVYRGVLCVRDPNQKEDKSDEFSMAQARWQSGLVTTYPVTRRHSNLF